MEKVFKEHGVRYGGALVAVIVVAVIGILTYVYKAIASLGSVTPATLFGTYFPLVMYVLMYYSIIKYVFDFFRDGADASIGEMLTRYCALTAASTVMGGTVPSYAMLVANTLILVMVPSAKEALGGKKALVYGIIVMVLAVVASVDKVMTGGAAMMAAAAGPLDAFVAAFNLVNPAVQWALFLVLMVIRGLQPGKVDTQGK